MRPKQPMPPTDELRARFGANVRKHRERLGISQWDLAFRAEMGITAISPVELGRTMPRIDSFIRLAGALGVTPGELAAGISWEPPETVVTPGGFEIPEDKELAKEAAALRDSAPYFRGRKKK